MHFIRPHTPGGITVARIPPPQMGGRITVGRRRMLRPCVAGVRFASPVVSHTSIQQGGRRQTDVVSA
jgi:hypothetical protein